MLIFCLQCKAACEHKLLWGCDDSLVTNSTKLICIVRELQTEIGVDIIINTQDHNDILSWTYLLGSIHYSDVIMSTMASQTTSLAIVYSSVISGADEGKHQSSASLAIVKGIPRFPAQVVVVGILFPEEYNRTHSICTTFIKSFHKCIPRAVAREAEAHRADNRYFNNDTAGGKQGARGIFYCSQMCRAHYILKMSGSISMGLIITYSLIIQHRADKYDIMTIANHAHKLL